MFQNILIYGYNNKFNASYCHFTEVFLFLISLIFLLQIKNKGLAQIHEKKETIFDSIKLGLNFVYKNI